MVHPDSPTASTVSHTRSRTVLKRSGSSRKSMIAVQAVSFFKQSLAGQTTLEEGDDSSGEEAGERLFYDTIYPLSYDRELVTFDILDHYFLLQRLGGPTFTTFASEPLDVLDLGCGAGTWILDTARSWILTHFVGFDVNLDMHPSTSSLQLSELHSRIRWVQGDLLQRLPFPNESFDFVRCSKIALAVPETKWQSLISEICRVLRPGGSLEIIEENLFFPMPTVRPLKPTRKERRARSGNAPVDSMSSMHGQDSQRAQATTSSRSNSPPPQHGVHGDTVSPDGSEGSQSSNFSLDRNERDPRDHRKLRRTWDAMLAARGINNHPLSILSLYLSTYFERFSAHTAGKGLVVPLPAPSSATVPNHADSSDDEDTPPPRSPVVAARPMTAKSKLAASSELIPENASLHLLRSLATVMACRESMLPHFQQLQHQERNPVEGRQPQRGGGVPIRKKRRRTFDRDEFDALIANYERDMLDRVGMGARLHTALGWEPPRPVAPPARDANSRWRDDIRMWRRHEVAGHVPADIDENICRNLNIWTATKAESDF